MDKQHVVQISIDVLVNDEYDINEIYASIENAGLDVLGIDITASWEIDEYWNPGGTKHDV